MKKSSENSRGIFNYLHSLTIWACICIILLAWFRHRSSIPSNDSIQGMWQKLKNQENDFTEKIVQEKLIMDPPSVKKTGHVDDIDRTVSVEAPSPRSTHDNTRGGSGNVKQTNEQEERNYEKLLKKIHDIPITGGGMTGEERDFLASAYKKDTTVFEWGMGASSVVANILNVKKLVSVDSAVDWVKNTRDMVNNTEYAFYYVDIGKVVKWGKPAEARSKKWLNYSAKVYDEKEPFDVYLVDGRFRVACACAALLHAKESSYIFIHDFIRSYYHPILKVAEKVGQVGKLVKLKLKANVPRKNIENMYNNFKYNYAR